MPKRKSKTRIKSSTAEYERLYKRARTQKCILRLYVTGITARSTQAITNIRAFCDEHLSGRYDLEVIDIYQQPAEAAVGQIIAAPTLIKQWPAPIRKIIGNLGDPKRVMKGLGLRASARPRRTHQHKKNEFEP